MPGKIHEFDIKPVPTGVLFKAGSRIALKIRCVDDELTNPLVLAATGSLPRTAIARVTVFHNEDYPFCLLRLLRPACLVPTTLRVLDL